MSNASILAADRASTIYCGYCSERLADTAASDEHAKVCWFMTQEWRTLSVLPYMGTTAK